jgi:hypothetical protein
MREHSKMCKCYNAIACASIFSLRQHGTASFFVGSFSLGGAKNNRQGLNSVAINVMLHISSPLQRALFYSAVALAPRSRPGECPCTTKTDKR